jgi:hypothetical protein
MHLNDVENPSVEVVKHANLHCVEDVGLWEIPHNTGNMSTHVAFWVHITRRESGISCIGVGIAEDSI